VHNYKVIHLSDDAVTEAAGKILPRTGHEVREGAYWCSFTLSLTSAIDAVGS
jgi:hypothetical protein